MQPAWGRLAHAPIKEGTILNQDECPPTSDPNLWSNPSVMGSAAAGKSTARRAIKPPVSEPGEVDPLSCPEAFNNGVGCVDWEPDGDHPSDDGQRGESHCSRLTLGASPGVRGRRSKRALAMGNVTAPDGVVPLALADKNQFIGNGLTPPVLSTGVNTGDAVTTEPPGISC